MKQLNCYNVKKEYKVEPSRSLPRLSLPSRNHRVGFSFYHSVILAVAGSLFVPALTQSAQAQTQVVRPPPTLANPDSVSQPVASELTMPPPKLIAPRVNKNDIGASADFMLGQGTITLPVGYGIQQIPGSTTQNNPVQAISGDRSTIYTGATISYSYGRAWYVDLSYEHGASAGSTIISFADFNGTIRANFNYTDDWYQLYVRYNIQDFLSKTRFKAYLRGGVSMVQATLTADDTASTQLYKQTDQTQDILGNIGFGLTYSLYSTVRLKVGLQAEGEGFYGIRSQDSTENLPQAYNSPSGKGSINNDLYGGIGRVTLHADLRLGHSGRLKLTTDVGLQIKYTMITYPGASAPDELLYGPYVKVGLSYLF